MDKMEDSAPSGPLKLTSNWLLSLPPCVGQKAVAVSPSSTGVLTVNMVLLLKCLFISCVYLIFLVFFLSDITVVLSL